jgi:hypothetical protein
MGGFDGAEKFYRRAVIIKEKPLTARYSEEEAPLDDLTVLGQAMGRRIDYGTMRRPRELDFSAYTQYRVTITISHALSLQDTG